MLFNSLAFLLFLPIVFLLYWAIPNKYRWMLLLTSSYYFYMCWNPKYIFLIFFTTVISYFAGLILEKASSALMKKIVLTVATITCLGILFFFKYFNFLCESIVSFLNIFSLHLHPLTIKLMLPVGISFYTFQTLSYVIDIYKGKIKAERHFGYYATFISFFPQLVAGPIERTNNLLPQIKKKHIFSYEQATYGLKLMAWGYFKKIVVADALAPYVSLVYNSPQQYYGFALVLATFFFTIQIYCDFSGYSDIAIGTAKLLGIDLSTNFKSPYFSQSIKEFWSRWHISLSTWFRDYIYIPLGGNRVSKLRHYINLLVTFLASGLWHGANWTFVAWGGIHGVAQVVENIVFPRRNTESKRLAWSLRVLSVFCFCSFAWIFFASNSIDDALYILSHILDGIKNPLVYIKNGRMQIELNKHVIFYLGKRLLLLGLFDYFSLKKDMIAFISSRKIWLRWTIYVVFIIWILLNSLTTTPSEFIYFQF